jgi:hypothetical protein
MLAYKMSGFDGAMASSTRPTVDRVGDDDRPQGPSMYVHVAPRSVERYTPFSTAPGVSSITPTR